MSSQKRIILVTGSNSGIGHDLVKLLALKGHIVYLAARNEAAGKEAQYVTSYSQTFLAHPFVQAKTETGT